MCLWIRAFNLIDSNVVTILCTDRLLFVVVVAEYSGRAFGSIWKIEKLLLELQTILGMIL